MGEPSDAEPAPSPDQNHLDGPSQPSAPAPGLPPPPDRLQETAAFIAGEAPGSCAPMPPADTSGGPKGEEAKPGCQAAPELPRVEGYELLGVLGRGGMGVVYQARQNGLKRLVALKLIRAGAHAGPDERARFRAEAEAVACLQHPHIVQVHEVGEADGCPYFALEFMDGGSLAAHLLGNPLRIQISSFFVLDTRRGLRKMSCHRRQVIFLRPATGPASPTPSASSSRKIPQH